MKRKIILTVVCIFFMFLILTAGCGDINLDSNDNNGTEEVGNNENKSPSLSLNLKFKTASDYGYSISKVTAKITKGTFTKEIELTIDNDNQSASGKFEELAIGEYDIEIKAYDGETQVAEGSGTATIEKNQETTADITIEYFTGDLSINVNLDDGNMRVFGLKSCGSNSSSFCGSGVIPNSLPPTILFSFLADGSDFSDIGTVTFNMNDIDADALAFSSTYGLLAFELKKSGFTTTSSTLISVNYSTAIATSIGSALNGRDIRGAVFDQSDTLWVLDANSDEVLNINPTTGEVIGTPIGLTFNGNPYDLSDASDIAVRADGIFFMTDHSNFYTLDILSGVLVLVNTDTGQGLAGAAFSNNAPQDAIFTYEVNNSDDIFRYDANSSFTRTPLHEDIISSFNSGRGDLASAFSFSEAQP